MFQETKMNYNALQVFHHGGGSREEEETVGAGEDKAK